MPPAPPISQGRPLVKAAKQVAERIRQRAARMLGKASLPAGRRCSPQDIRLADRAGVCTGWADA